MKLVIIRGLPGSGKSTMAKTLALVGYQHFEADQYFINELGEYRFDPTRLNAAHAWCLLQAKNSLLQGKDCVVSNTFTQLWEMKPYIDLARTLDAEIQIIVASGDWKNVHGAPEEAIERMRARWEPSPFTSLTYEYSYTF